MAYQRYYDDILDAHRGAPYKQVLVVEGSADVEFLDYMLDKEPYKSRNYYMQWIVAEAGGKENCLKMIERNEGWHALVDRDCWTDVEAEDMRRKYPTLHILPRFCIENYMCHPQEIFAALGKMQRTVKTEQKLARLFLPHMDDALRHGALWRAVQPLYNGLRDLGFNDVLLNFRVPADEDIMKILNSWHSYLDPSRIQGEYYASLELARSLSLEDQLFRWIHGKYFFQNAVIPTLEASVDRRGIRAWRRHLLRNMPMPDDLSRGLGRIFGDGHHFRAKNRKQDLA